MGAYIGEGVPSPTPFPEAVWSKNSSSLAVSEKFKYCNADEFIEGTGGILGRELFYAGD